MDPPSIKDEYINETLLEVKPSDTYVSLSIPRFNDLFYCANDNILNYSIIVYRDNKGFDTLSPTMPTWAESFSNHSINIYQTTSDQWMPFNS